MKNNIKLIALTAFAISSQVIVAFDVEDTDQHRSPVSRESVPSPVITTIHAPSSPRSATPPRQRTGIVDEIVREQTIPSPTGVHKLNATAMERLRQSPEPLITHQDTTLQPETITSEVLSTPAPSSLLGTRQRAESHEKGTDEETLTGVRAWIASLTPNMPAVSLRMPTTREAVTVAAAAVVLAGGVAYARSDNHTVRDLLKRK